MRSRIPAPIGGTVWDFFVSYTGRDRPWAEWIAWQLEDAGYRVLIQAWDFVPGTNWTTKMKTGIRKARRTIAVLSPNYLESVYGTVEWRGAWRSDPQGQRRKLIPVLVRPVEPEGHLSFVVSIDLVDLDTEEGARGALLKGVAAALSGRDKPLDQPFFPAAGDVPADPAGRPVATSEAEAEAEAGVGRRPARRKVIFPGARASEPAPEVKRSRWRRRIGPQETTALHRAAFGVVAVAWTAALGAAAWLAGTGAAAAWLVGPLGVAVAAAAVSAGAARAELTRRDEGFALAASAAAAVLAAFAGFVLTRRADVGAVARVIVEALAAGAGAGLTRFYLRRPSVAADPPEPEPEPAPISR